MKTMTIVRKHYCLPIGVLLAILLAILLPLKMAAQATRHISLQEAIKMGIENSKMLKLSESRIAAANAQLAQTKDANLPNAKFTAAYSQLYAPANTLSFGPQKSFSIPDNGNLYLSTLSVTEPIFAGSRINFAKVSAELLVKIAALDAQKDREAIAYNVISAYYNLYKILQSQQIVAQNLQTIEERLTEIRKFEQQGLATRNDVLRWELQKSNAQLNQLELNNNRNVVNYNMNILLGLDGKTLIETDDLSETRFASKSLDEYLSLAYTHRKDLTSYQYQSQLTEVNIKSVRSEKLPMLAAAANVYYINPTKKFIPDVKSYLAPMTLGLNLSWNIASLYTNKNKMTAAQVQKEQVNLAQSQLKDNIQMEIYKNYTGYLQALDRIRVLQTAVAQAEENDRIMESKYKNNVASTTDRIDAATLLFQSRINLSLAKADAQMAYYQLIQSTGTLTQ